MAAAMVTAGGGRWRLQMMAAVSSGVWWSTRHGKIACAGLARTPMQSAIRRRLGTLFASAAARSEARGGLGGLKTRKRGGLTPHAGVVNRHAAGWAGSASVGWASTRSRCSSRTSTAARTCRPPRRCCSPRRRASSPSRCRATGSTRTDECSTGGSSTTPAAGSTLPPRARAAPRASRRARRGPASHVQGAVHACPSREQASGGSESRRARCSRAVRFATRRSRREAGRPPAPPRSAAGELHRARRRRG